jgi:hypothetical protein
MAARPAAAQDGPMSAPAPLEVYRRFQWFLIHIMNCPAAQNPAEGQLATHRGGLPVAISTCPFEMPGAG